MRTWIIIALACLTCILMSPERILANDCTHKDTSQSCIDTSPLPGVECPANSGNHCPSDYGVYTLGQCGSGGDLDCRACSGSECEIPIMIFWYDCDNGQCELKQTPSTITRPDHKILSECS